MLTIHHYDAFVHHNIRLYIDYIIGDVDLENYNNTVVITADRNGSTAFIESIKIDNYNLTYEINLAECFSQDYDDNPRYEYKTGQNSRPRPHFWNEQIYKPSQVIDAINIGTGKKVILKCLITWQNFNELYFNIKAKRKIFLYRNMFDSSLSKCLAEKTGEWHNDVGTDTHTIPEDFFTDILEWRIERYSKFLDQILDWTNEIVIYEEYKFKEDISVKKHPDRKMIVSNYNNLKEIYRKYSYSIDAVEKEILLAKKCLTWTT